ncbi:hypothetical protein B9Z19DRAFT_1195500 [Tuber borchii]|uniref:SecE/sec61-gamma protein n=1 Tax=Tuber borchii TaxID=42251 RepID=A0A2T6ZIW2_TUBBO|nr:hypothetical protein B9Z19DRAFT_1195500 [Tuber borchii]
MSDQFAQMADIPREFLRDGTLFINRCTKPDKREFIKISQAVGIGFVIMGVIGFIVKLIHIPVNNILVYVSFPLYSKTHSHQQSCFDCCRQEHY